MTHAFDSTLCGFDIQKAWDYENGFHLTSPTTRLAKMLAHYELYKSIVDLPGHVIECGVYKGTSLLQFATYRDLLESQHSRAIVGFDTFAAFPRPDDAVADDIRFIDQFERAGGAGWSVEQLQAVFVRKGFTNIELIAGDILSTVPDYVRSRPEARIALLHVDVDVYRPTVAILDAFYDRIVSGGLLVFDDFGTVAGETRAAEEFCAARGLSVQKLPLAQAPVFVRKR